MKDRKTYEALVKLTESFALEHGVSSIVTEPAEVFDKCFLNICSKDLMQIRSDKEFVQACFLKLLDRTCSEAELQAHSLKLQLKSTSRKEVISSFAKRVPGYSFPGID